MATATILAPALRRACAGAAMLLGLAVLPWTAGAATNAAPYDEETALRISGAAIGRSIGDYSLRDSSRRPVRLSDYRGKPLIISMVYTGCISACPLIIQSLYRAIEAAQEALGEDSFAVVTVGFDSRNDSPDRMRAFAREQGADLPNWKFLAAGPDVIESLSRDLGFIFYPSSKGFDHLAQTTIVDENGVVYRQVYGADFDPPLVVEHLKDLVFGRAGNLTSISGLVNRLRLFCTIYDPAAGRYRFDYSIFIGGSVALFALTGLGVAFVRVLWRTRNTGDRA